MLAMMTAMNMTSAATARWVPTSARGVCARDFSELTIVTKMTAKIKDQLWLQFRSRTGTGTAITLWHGRPAARAQLTHTGEKDRWNPDGAGGFNYVGGSLITDLIECYRLICAYARIYQAWRAQRENAP